MLYPHEGSCAGYQEGSWTCPQRCPGQVVAAGIVFFEHPRPVALWAFACAHHAEVLIAARPLLERDLAEIARRRALHEQRKPGRSGAALARGRAACELGDQARRWAAAHPERLHPTTRPAARADVEQGSDRRVHRR